MKETPFTYSLKLCGMLLAFMLLFHAQTFLFNHKLYAFSNVNYLQALRFDVSMLGYLSLPLLLLALAVSVFKWKRGLLAIKWVAIALFVFILLTEMWDLIYLNYTAKRATYEVYLFYIFGNDFNQLHALLTRFWAVIFALFIWLAVFLFAITKLSQKQVSFFSIPRSFFTYLVTTGIAFLLARNSLGPKPLGIADAMVSKDPIGAQMTLNSPFVVLKTIQNTPLPTTQFVPDSIEKKEINPLLNLQGNSTGRKFNVFILIVESLGSKQLFQSKHGIRLTPFLDGLANIQQNEFGVNGIAEGKTSIECLPGLLGGIPSLLDVPFMLSNYSPNQLTGFPTICNRHGYASYFVHGAKRGSMRFDALAHSLGFNHLWFKENLTSTPKDEGSWGIHDHAVLAQLSKKIPRINQPFMMTVFTLSTHEPFDLPTSFSTRYKQLSPEDASYRFIDDNLRSFFEKNKHKSWFKNTLFVITGDHTPVHLDNGQYQIADYYKVPIFILPPTTIKASFSVQEQKDIVPSICKALQWDTQLYSFANDPHSDHIRFLNGQYYIWNDSFQLTFNETKKTWRVSLKSFKNSSHIDKKSLHLKIEGSKTKFLSLLQRFRKDLRLNKTHR